MGENLDIELGDLLKSESDEYVIDSLLRILPSVKTTLSNHIFRSSQHYPADQLLDKDKLFEIKSMTGVGDTTYSALFYKDIASKQIFLEISLLNYDGTETIGNLNANLTKEVILKNKRKYSSSDPEIIASGIERKSTSREDMNYFIKDISEKVNRYITKLKNKKGGSLEHKPDDAETKPYIDPEQIHAKKQEYCSRYTLEYSLNLISGLLSQEKKDLTFFFKETQEMLKKKYTEENLIDLLVNKFEGIEREHEDISLTDIRSYLNYKKNQLHKERPFKRDYINIIDGVYNKI